MECPEPVGAGMVLEAAIPVAWAGGGGPGLVLVLATRVCGRTYGIGGILTELGSRGNRHLILGLEVACFQLAMHPLR